MSTLLKIKILKKEMTNIEKKIANYILNNINELKNLNTYEIAQNCDVSQASIVRFSKKLGFSGFPNFKISLVQDLGKINLENEISVLDDEIDSKDSFSTICKKIAAKNINAVQNTISILDTKEIEKAINMIEKAKKIMIIGVGFSGIVAKDFSFKLTEIGKNVIFETDQHMQLSYLTTFTKKDIVFAISYSGQTKEVYSLVKEAKARNIPIISLTTLAPNLIRDLADVKLNTVDLGEHYRGSSLSPRISQFTIIDSIYVSLVIKNKDMENYIKNAIELVKEHKIKK
ncbi:MAG: MurR/RpiR family transcriptional regulator [Fusobacterium sp.]|nr:MurR/RpiR family transcriptional regulator [Fusobacterium sp.]MDO4690889.1 MurR/RpiR family transcriptional regulator [Fusobacterium sp.]